ncbi:MAG TPA: transcription antitermination factor NusB [Flavobacteriaceae bacterium]|nr:transcription antitermination factor NusB [Flavobacteriaceae bacterium]
MLTRRHIRVKVLQSIYAYQNEHEANLQKQEKFLIYSMEQMHDLFLLMLDIMVQVQNHAESFMLKSQKKFLATETDKKPNRKFVENRVLKQISDNKVLGDLKEQRNLTNWSEDNEYVHLLFKTLRESEMYHNYLSSQENSYQEDKAFVISFFKEIVAPNEKLYDYLEDKKLTWLDDFPIVNTAIVKSLEVLTPSLEDRKFIKKLYKNEDDKEFAIQLFRKTVLNNEKLEEEISGKTPNWDRERIAELDLIMIKMGLIEFMHFPSIPVKVTINEYLEIAKEYSTPKSSIFINGILDKKVKDYTTTNKLNKIGRGLQ